MAQWQHQFNVMGGPAQLVLDREDILLCDVACALAESIAREYERKYSRYRDDSVLNKINRHAGNVTRIDQETAALLQFAERAYQISDGLFDITSGALRRAWNFASGKPPSDDQINALLPFVSWKAVQWDETNLCMPSGMELDLGGLVKEYAADAIVRALKDRGLKHGFISLAGDIAVIGPQADGRPWKVGISDPDAPEQAKAHIDLQHGALASSGDYERFFIYQGKRYCHILNPFTGQPVQGVAGVSVQADLCIVAGTLSTIALLKGPEQGRAFLHNTGLPFLLFPRQM